MRTLDSRDAVCHGVLGTNELYLCSHHSSRCCANDSENSIRMTMRERLPCGRRLGLLPAFLVQMDWFSTRLRRWTKMAGFFSGTPSSRRAWSKRSHAASSTLPLLGSASSFRMIS